tara:strand:+ start:408 stop:713 length:306 start_codon:yes stop_codon:yes gene_type:complete
MGVSHPRRLGEICQRVRRKHRISAVSFVPLVVVTCLRPRFDSKSDSIASDYLCAGIRTILLRYDIVGEMARRDHGVSFVDVGDSSLQEKVSCCRTSVGFGV